MDNSLIVMLVIAALTALSNWMQKKNRIPEGDESGIPPLPKIPRRTDRPSGPEQTTPRPVQQPEWEKLLRRLLEGDVPDSTPPVAPPPVIVPERRPNPAPPPIRTVPKPAPVPATAARQPAEGPAFALAKLPESESAYTNASQLLQQTATRMRHVDEQTQHHRARTPERHRRGASEDIAAAIAMIREPRSVRRALINSIILGPPKALEN